MIQYAAKIKFSKQDGCYLVEFPNLPGCLTYGDTLEEAKLNAAEALTGYLESIDLRKMEVPRPKKIKANDIYYIEPDKRVAFALWLKIKRMEKGLTQKKAAEMLKVNFQSYQKYENLNSANPTLKTILKIEKAFKENIIRL
jgi:antitoxin HicB